MARRSAHLNLLQTCSLGILLTGITLYANGIEHHGFQVNSEGSYQECLACHDGLAAPNISPCLGPVCTFKDSHPVDRPYPPPAKMQEFASPGAAEMAGIKFVEGRIDCISCHDLTNPDRYHLRVENRGSRLCLACHLK